MRESCFEIEPASMACAENAHVAEYLSKNFHHAETSNDILATNRSINHSPYIAHVLEHELLLCISTNIVSSLGELRFPTSWTKPSVAPSPAWRRAEHCTETA